MRRYGVALTVARQEHRFPSADSTEGERAGRLAVRRAYRQLSRDLEVGKPGEPAAADDG